MNLPMPNVIRNPRHQIGLLPLHAATAMLLVLAALANADTWELITADFKSQNVDLKGCSPAGIRVSVSGNPQTIPLDNFLQIHRAAPAASSEKFTVHLITGDRILGQPAGYKDEQIVWSNSIAGQVTIPLKQTRALVRAGKTIENMDLAPTEDRILLNNGDSIKGIVTDISAETVKINSNNSDVSLPTDGIAWIHFAPAGKPQISTARAFRVTLSDGSTLTATGIDSADEKFSLTLADKSQHMLAAAVIAGIEQLNGPVSWLSSRTPQAIVQTPYFGGTPWPTRMDQSVGGKLITFGGRAYARGIGVHSYSRLDYVLDGSYAAFRTQYAISNEARNQYADVTIRIKLDGAVVHEKAHLRAGELGSANVDLPVSAKILTLEVDYGDANDTQDRVNWVEPALLRKKS